MKTIILLAPLALLGCTHIRGAEADAGKGGYMILNDGSADTWIYYCQPAQDIRNAECRAVHKISQ